MLKLPSKIKIGKTTYSLSSVKDINEGRTMGRTHRMSSKIEYCTQDVSDEQQVITVLHECIHAMIYTYNMQHSLRLTDENEELLVCMLEQPLYAFIKDNPKLIKILQEV